MLQVGLRTSHELPPHWLIWVAFCKNMVSRKDCMRLMTMVLKAKGTCSDIPFQVLNWALITLASKPRRVRTDSNLLLPVAPLQPHGMSLKLLDGSWAECSTLCSRGVSMSDVGVASWLATCLVHLKSFSPAACVSARILESQACHHQPRTSIIINNFINNFFCWEKTRRLQLLCGHLGDTESTALFSASGSHPLTCI